MGPEELAVEWVQETIDTWVYSTVTEFVWNHDDVDISSMSDVQVRRLIRDVERIALNKIIIIVGE